MKNIILDLAVTLDGFIEGSNGEIDWCIMDDGMDLSYDTWGNFQPEENASEATLKLWQAVHSKKKYVFSSHNRQDDKASY